MLVIVWYAVENERLTWELTQLQGLVDNDELDRLRADTDTLRQQMLHMHAQTQVTPSFYVGQPVLDVLTCLWIGCCKT